MELAGHIADRVGERHRLDWFREIGLKAASQHSLPIVVTVPALNDPAYSAGKVRPLPPTKTIRQRR